MNTEFLGGLLVARMVEGVKFAVGPTVAARRKALEAIGGFAVLKDYLAEDFVMGKFASRSGLRRDPFAKHRRAPHRQPELACSAWHRLRWARSTRRSRPLGYIGQVFTHSLAIALLAAEPWVPAGGRRLWQPCSPGQPRPGPPAAWISESEATLGFAGLWRTCSALGSGWPASWVTPSSGGGGVTICTPTAGLNCARIIPKPVKLQVYL